MRRLCLTCDSCTMQPTRQLLSCWECSRIAARFSFGSTIRAPSFVGNCRTKPIPQPVLRRTRRHKQAHSLSDASGCDEGLRCAARVCAPCATVTLIKNCTHRVACCCTHRVACRHALCCLISFVGSKPPDFKLKRSTPALPSATAFASAQVVDLVRC